MKFVVAMMLAGMVLAFAGINEAFAQGFPVTNDYTIRTDKGPATLDQREPANNVAKFRLNMTGLGLINDPDGDLAQASMTIVRQSGNATGLINTPAAPHFLLVGSYGPEDAGGQEIFEYELTDEADLKSKGLITVNVHPLAAQGNARPSISLPPAVQVTEGGSAEVDVSPYISDDDPEVELVVTFSHHTNSRFVQGGTFQVLGPTTILYQAPDETNSTRPVTEGIQFTVEDDVPRTGSAIARSQVNFLIFPNETTSEPAPPPNQPPTANNPPQATVQAGQPVTINVASLISDPEGGALTVTVPATVNGGVATVAGTVITYTAGNTAGTFSFDYTVTDPDGATGTGTVTIVVTPAPVEDVNRAPTVNIPSTPTALEAGNTITIDVDPYINDPDGDALTVTITTQPAQGTADISGTVITYTAPDDAEAGPVSIGITVSDGTDTATGTVPIVIVEGNTVPIRACTR